MEKIIGIIGFGNMGSAIADRIKDKYNLCVFDKDKEKTKAVSGIKVCAGISDLAKEAQVIILAVKPQDFDDVLGQLKDYLKEKLLISIAAGINTGYIEKTLGEVRIIRAMPNIAVRIGQGITCLSKGNFAGEEDFDFARNLFDYVGKTMHIEEKRMNAATAVSGSGPAYICDYMESQSLGLDNTAGKIKEDFLNDFQKAAMSVGFNPQEAAFLVNNTFSGTVNFLKIMNLSPEQLKRQVVSKGGTTEAALAVLHSGGSLEEAVRTAFRRAEELSKKE